MTKKKQTPPDRTHYPTPASRALVQIHATVGTRQELIADLLDIDAKTLRKHYRTELDHSKARANAEIGGALFKKARGGDTAAMIFWMKTQAGWKETNVIEGKDGGPLKIEYVMPVPHKHSEGYTSE
ncbi:MAG: hypothetical protein ACK5VI_01105 [Opitutia bacterium]